MALTNFQFFKSRCQKRWNRRDTSKESFFFICYIFYKDSTFATVRNNMVSLNGVVENNVSYFEGVWEDHYNTKYNDDVLDPTHIKVPDHHRVHVNDRGQEYEAPCQCDSEDALENGFFYITSNTVRKCQHDDENVCPCDDIMCPDCTCVTLDGGMKFMRIIGIQGLKYWYDNRYTSYDEELKLENLSSEDYMALMDDEVLKIGVECNAFILQLEQAMKRDYEYFVLGKQDTSDKVVNVYECTCDRAYNKKMYGKECFCSREDNMSTYRFEGKLKDRYEAFIYEWRQAVIKFRLDYGVFYAYRI